MKDFKNEWLESCFGDSKAKPDNLFVVERSDNDYVGPYSINTAIMVSREFGGAPIINVETGELV